LQGESLKKRNATTKIALAFAFVVCEQGGMDIKTLRTEMGLSQEGFATLLGLKSKGHVCDLERTGKASVRVALEIEALSAGAIPADRLNADVALVRSERRATVAKPATVIPMKGAAQ